LNLSGLRLSIATIACALLTPEPTFSAPRHQHLTNSMLPDPLVTPILLILIASLVAALVPRRLSAWVGVTVAVAAASVYVYAGRDITPDAPVSGEFWNIPSLGVIGGLQLDGLSGLFA